MKFRINEKSLFAVLLRSPWWMSLVIAALLFAGVRLVIPEVYAAFSALPFVVISAIAAFKQSKIPGPERVAQVTEAVNAMGWQDFSGVLQAGLTGAGWKVLPYEGQGADFELRQGTGITLCCARRWKGARVGVDALKELDAARRKHGAGSGLFVATGQISAQARTYAAENAIRFVEPLELAGMLKLK